MRARGTTLVRVSVRRGHAKLFNCLSVEPEDRTACDVAPVGVQRTNHQNGAAWSGSCHCGVAGLLVIDIHAIERYV